MKPDGRGRISLGKGNMDTASTPTIRVEIYNQTYNIRSDGDSEYITQLAEFVDTRMREISSGTLTVDSLKVAILAALHIADELHRLKRLHEQTDSQLASRSAECAEMLDRLLKVRTSVEQQNPAPGNIAFT
ncbi:MAG TPA: cell division protein ZapA [Pyrinomonadaceae bacterium]|jgi:cell division protein ZapA|nr:cell division protein ZapA [Pyrinomonadaceae bacterium]